MLNQLAQAEAATTLSPGTVTQKLDLVFHSLSADFLPLLGETMGTASLDGLLNGLFTTALVIGLILAVLRFSYAGLIYMTSEVWTHKEDARKILRDTAVGVFILLGIWVILFQINPQILNLDFLRVVKEKPVRLQDAYGGAGVQPEEPPSQQ